MTRLTVIGATPAAAATSVIFTALRLPRGGGISTASAGSRFVVDAMR
jgi:hypothetical protein